MSYGTEHIFAIFVCAVIAIIAVFFTWYIFETRKNLRDRPPGRHGRMPFAHPDAAADRDGTVTQAWLRGLHAEELPAAGRLPVDPPADTRPQPAIKDVELCELGMPTDQYLDELFAKYAEVTG